MYSNVNRFQTMCVDGTPLTQGDPSSDTTVFYCAENTDRYVVLAKSKNGGTSKMRYWFYYDIDNDTKTDLGLSVNYILSKQPFEVEVTNNSFFEARSVLNTGAKGIYVEVTDGQLDILVSANHLNIENH